MDTVAAVVVVVVVTAVGSESVVSLRIIKTLLDVVVVMLLL